MQDAEARVDAVADAIRARSRERERILRRLARDVDEGVSDAEVRSDAAEAVADHPDILAITLHRADAVAWVEPESADTSS